MAIASLIIAAIAGVAVAATVAFFHPQAVAAGSGSLAAGGGKLVILEPHKWIDQRLPVLRHIVAQGSDKPLGKQLATGQWTVMFYHASCDECRRTIPVYEALARREALSGKTPHIAFIRVPTGSGVPSAGLFHSSLPLHGILDASHEWFATTPVIVELKRGVVVRVVTGAAAMRLNWRRTAGAALSETARLLSVP